jgi:hypothetical protein
VKHFSAGKWKKALFRKYLVKYLSIWGLKHGKIVLSASVNIIYVSAHIEPLSPHFRYAAPMTDSNSDIGSMFDIAKVT